MNHFEYIKSKNIDEFAEWLAENGLYDYAPWDNWFDDNYCSKCGCYSECGAESENFNDYAWCELYGNCKFFPEKNNVLSPEEVIKLWLELEV